MDELETARALEVLQSPNAANRVSAARYLGTTREARAVPALVHVLTFDPEPAAQEAAAQALGRIRDVQAVPALIACFKGQTFAALRGDGSPGAYFRIVAAAARALASVGDPRGVASLFEELQNPTPHNDLRTAAAVSGVAVLDDERVLPSLLAALESRSDDVRCEAARALGERRQEQAIDGLIARLQDNGWMVRLAVITALGDLRAKKAIEHLRGIYRAVDAYVPSTIVDEFVSEQALACIEAQAARALALIGDAESLSLLESDFLSPRQRESFRAATGLAYRQDRRVLPVLATAFQARRKTGAQLAAVEALAQLDEPEAKKFLEDTSQRKDLSTSVTGAAKDVLEGMRGTGS